MISSAARSGSRADKSSRMPSWFPFWTRQVPVLLLRLKLIRWKSSDASSRYDHTMWKTDCFSFWQMAWKIRQMTPFLSDTGFPGSHSQTECALQCKTIIWKKSKITFFFIIKRFTAAFYNKIQMALKWSSFPCMSSKHWQFSEAAASVFLWGMLQVPAAQPVNVCISFSFAALSNRL